jgi:2'-5' RNA ligase superfamily
VTSAVIVTVPEAEPVVGELRLRHTYDAPLGVPAHVTLLYPFVPAERVGEVEERLALLLRGHAAFDAAFARTARFPGVLYLDPEPAEVFAALTEAIAGEWPEHPPYEGAHETVIPHLTVAESEDGEFLDRIAAEVESQLPVRTRIAAATLIVEDEHGRWHEHGRLPLGYSGVA